MDSWGQAKEAAHPRRHPSTYVRSWQKGRDSQGNSLEVAVFLAEQYFSPDCGSEDDIISFMDENQVWGSIPDDDWLATRRSESGKTVLLAVAAAGHGNVIKTLLDCVKAVDEAKAKSMVVAPCNEGRSALAYAIGSGSAVAFSAILELLTLEEARQQLRADKDKVSALTLAVRDEDTFQRVREILKTETEFADEYPNWYGKELHEFDARNRPLLLLAAGCGVKAVYDIVAEDLRGTTHEDINTAAPVANVGENADTAGAAELYRHLRDGVCNARNSLMAAAAGGNIDIFESVLEDLENRGRCSCYQCSNDLFRAESRCCNAEITKKLRATDQDGRTALMLAATVQPVSGAPQHSFGYDSSLQGKAEVFATVFALLLDCHVQEEDSDAQQKSRELLCAEDSNGCTALMHACVARNRAVVEEIVKRVALPFLALDKDYGDGDTALNKCNGDKEIMRILLSCGATPNEKFFEDWSRSDGELDSLEELFVRAIVEAENPLVPCLTLSGALASASCEGRREDGHDRQIWADLLALIDKITAAILEILPRVSNQILGSLVTAGYLIEPERLIRNSTDFRGPLEAALTRRHLDFLSAPMVVDYVELQFSHGMGNASSTHVFKRPDVLVYFQDPPTDKFLEPLGGKTDFAVMHDTAQRHTYLPGFQLSLAGLATRPDVMYRIPAMHLAMNAVSYIGVLILYNHVVLLREEEISAAEGYFWACTFGIMLTEYRQLRSQGWTRYFAEQWNNVDAAYSLLLFSAFVSRMVGCLSWGGNHLFWAQLLLALAGPLLWYRLLSLAQLHSRLGPTVQIINMMLRELALFMVVLTVLMMGFIVTFHALFSSQGAIRSDGGAYGYQTYGATLLTLFSAMLGDFDFDAFDNVAHGTTGIVLLCTYVTVMSIMLLNLLVAVLVAAHAVVTSNIDKEFRRGQAFLFMESIKGTDADLLPTPLNLLQEVLALRLCGHVPEAKRVLGKLFFAVFMGAFGVIGSTLLWYLSLPLGIKAAVQSSSKPERIPGLVLEQCYLYLIKVPLHCFVMWIYTIGKLLGQYGMVLKKQLLCALRRTVSLACYACSCSGRGSVQDTSVTETGRVQPEAPHKPSILLSRATKGSQLAGASLSHGGGSAEATILKRQEMPRANPGRSGKSSTATAARWVPVEQRSKPLDLAVYGDEGGDGSGSTRRSSLISLNPPAGKLRASQKSVGFDTSTGRARLRVPPPMPSVGLRRATLTSAASDDDNRRLCREQLEWAFNKRGGLANIVKNLRRPKGH